MQESFPRSVLPNPSPQPPAPNPEYLASGRALEPPEHTAGDGEAAVSWGGPIEKMDSFIERLWWCFAVSPPTRAARAWPQSVSV